MIYSPSGYVYRLVKVSDCSGNRDKPLIRKGNRKEARCAGNILIHIYIYTSSPQITVMDRSAGDPDIWKEELSASVLIRHVS